MKEFIKLIAEISESLESDSTQISKLVKKIGTFSTCPLTKKHAERMQPFSDSETVHLIAPVLNERKFPTSNDITFSSDIVAYFYCIALLSNSNEKIASNTLKEITERMIEENYADIYLLKRNFSFFKNRADLQSLKSLIVI